MLKYKNRLKGVHPDLVRVLLEFEKTSKKNYTISEGLRTLKTQKDYVKRGLSKTMNSRHLTGRAVDIHPLTDKGALDTRWIAYTEMANGIKAAARKLGVSIIWGGDWVSFRDGPHVQLKDSFSAFASVLPSETVYSSTVKKILASGVSVLTYLGTQFTDVYPSIAGYLPSVVSKDIFTATTSVAIVAGILYVSYKSFKDSQEHTKT